MKNQSLKNKIFVMTLAFIMVFTGLGISSWGVGEAWADTDEITVFVSISSGGTVVNDKDGSPMALAPVTLTGKETYTMGDALSQAHELYYQGGAEAGYAAATGDYGEYITKLWGNETGNFEYQLRQGDAYVSVMGLSQEVAEGNIIDAYINQSSYPDNETHSYFDKSNITVSTGESFNLTLKTVTEYDQSWNSVYGACEAAVITVDGEATQYKTDADGKASIQIDSAGTYLISAVKTKKVGEDTVTSITAPLCKVQAVEPIDVTVSAQRTLAFNYMPNTVSVAYGTAAKYGFSNGSVPEGTITALDALVAAHVEKYGEAFTKETAGNYLTTNGTSPVKMFENDATSKNYSGFAVNHSYYMDGKGMGYMANTAPLKSGDLVDFFYYEDVSWGDTVAWFEDASGKKLDTLNVESGEDIELYLKGFKFMSGDSSPTPEPIYNGDGGLSVYVVNEEGSPEYELATVTEDTGVVKLKFDQPGTYYITAMGYEAKEFLVTMPWLKVTVNEAGSITTNTASAITISGITYDFQKDIYAYDLPRQLYSKGSLSFNVTAGDAKEIKASVNGGAEVSLTSNKAKSLNIAAGKNTIKISIVPKDSSNALTKSYIYNVSRDVSAKTISLTTEGNNVKLDKTFSTSVYSYTANMLTGATAAFAVTTQGDTANSKVTINGEDVQAGYTISTGSNVFTVKIESKDGTVEKTYTITITGVSSVSNSITVPEGAVLKVWDPSGNLLKNGEGNTVEGKTTYTLSNLLTGEKYTLQVSKYGFSAKGGEFTAASDDSDNLEVALKAASEPTSSVTAEWENFRNGDDNMAVVSLDLPKTSEETALKWSQSGASTKRSPGTQIIVNDKIVYTSGNKVSLINKTTGAIEKTTTMEASKGLGYMPATYGGGMIYVALSGGMIQAFDAVTLESKWIYKDNLGGQALSSITYNDGYIYTGFWNSATTDANYVCISVADEDTAVSDEAKYATWTYTHTGGFYWSGAYISGDNVVVGADNKTLLLLNKKTGAVLDTVTVDGDIRCSIAYSDGKIYFVTKGGSLYSAALSENKITGLAIKASIGGESTSTPVIVNGYAYVGVKNKKIAQVKISDGTVNPVVTPAYSQSSLLANTADSSKTYLYFTCNAEPGGVQVIEVDNTSGEMTLSDLYTPPATQQNFGISSIICDTEGTLYYYNDSGNLFALEKQAISTNTQKLSFSVTAGGTTQNGAVISLVKENNNVSITPNGDGNYILHQGVYSYKITLNQYKEVAGRVTIGTNDVNIPIAMVAESTTTTENPQKPASNEITVTVLGLNGAVIYPYSSMTYSAGMTALSALLTTGLNVNWTESDMGSYVEEIEGLGEFDEGPNSGWLYSVNGVDAGVSSGSYILKAGDRVVWRYTSDYTKEPSSQAWAPVVQPTTTTTTQTPAKVTGDAAAAALTQTAADKLITDAVSGKSGQIKVEVTSTGSAAEINLQLTKKLLTDMIDKTSASLVITAGDSQITLDREALKSVISQTKGDTIDIIIKKIKSPSESMTTLLGDKATIFELTVKSGDTIISTFGGGKLKLELPYSGTFAKPILVCVGADNKLEKFSSTVVTSNGKKFLQATVTHLSTYAIMDETEADAIIKAQAAEEGKKADNSKLIAGVKSTKVVSLKAKTTKSKVTLTWKKSNSGYKVDGYQIWKSTKKTSGFKKVFTTTKKSYKNTKDVKAGTTYWYKVRGYRKVDGKTIYTPFIKIKAVAKK